MGRVSHSPHAVLLVLLAGCSRGTATVASESQHAPASTAEDGGAVRIQNGSDAGMAAAGPTDAGIPNRCLAATICPPAFLATRWLPDRTSNEILRSSMATMCFNGQCFTRSLADLFDAKGCMTHRGIAFSPPHQTLGLGLGDCTLGKTRRFIGVTGRERDREDWDTYDVVLRSAAGNVLAQVHDRAKYRAWDAVGPCETRECWSFEDDRGHCLGVRDTLPLCENQACQPGDPLCPR
jgi:hypothetical protein